MKTIKEQHFETLFLTMIVIEMSTDLHVIVSIEYGKQNISRVSFIELLMFAKYFVVKNY